MNGVHDMGGMHGFGPVVPERDEPVFHARWEGRVLAMSRATSVLGLWNIDQSRASIETLPPQVYLGVSYYEKWQLALESRLLAHGLIASDELTAGHALHAARSVRPILHAADVDGRLHRGRFERPAPHPARFAPRERVRARNLHPATHTRLPRYVRGHIGQVLAIRGCHVFPDAMVRGEGERPQWLYTVVFAGRELWGEEADPALSVSIDAFEPYLEPA